MNTDPSNFEFTPSSKLNFVIGICAMLLSIASFYATFIQARSAEQQVKAMTYPLLQYSSGNFNLETKEEAITMTVTNSGVGPAIVKSVAFIYDGQKLDNLSMFLKACCDEAMAITNAKRQFKEAPLITSRIKNRVLSAGEKVKLLSLPKHQITMPIWERLNGERFKVSIETCYCSLLDNCYTSQNAGQIVEVKSCPDEGDDF